MQEQVDLAEYQCGVCLEIPAEIVHQCNNGHFYCIGCWQEIQSFVESKRVCPECRCSLPAANRSLVQERAIAKLPATCATCGARMTRGELKTHELASSPLSHPRPGHG